MSLTGESLGVHSTEPILNKMPVECKRLRNTETLHYGEAQGVGEGEVFIGVLVEYRLSACFVAGHHSNDNRVALPQVSNELKGYLDSEAGHHQRMRLEEDSIGGELAVAVLAKSRENALSFLVMLLVPIQQGKVGAGVDKDLMPGGEM